nr:hypothetical protein CFP56_51560 [Quercus suber]
MCSSSRSAHVTDEPRCGEGTSGALCDSEQSTEQEEGREGVYGPWIVVTRRKNRTKLLRSGGTSPKQSSVFSFKDNGYVEKESLVRADAHHGPSRDVKRKLSPPKFIERAQIATAFQSLRRDGPKQAQRNPKMMLKSGDAKPNVSRPKSVHISQSFSSVKEKKEAARSGFTFGEQSSAVGGSKSSCDMDSQLEVNANTVGKLGQCNKPMAGARFAGGSPLSVSTVLTVGFQGYDAGKANPIQEVVQVDSQGCDVGKAEPIHEVVQFRMHKSTNGYSNSTRDEDVDGKVDFLKSGVGRPCDM